MENIAKIFDRLIKLNNKINENYQIYDAKKEYKL